MSTPALTEEDRIRLTLGIMVLFDEWQIDPVHQVTLLGLPADTQPRKLDRYRKGTPLPDEDEIMARVEQLISIHDALLTTYPRNSRMGLVWLSRPNRNFNGRPPLQIMVEGGLQGMLRVRGRLDCTLGWI
jgi:hypothetical protein